MLKTFRVPYRSSLRIVRHGLYAMLALLILPSAIFAQTGAGTIQGNVRDVNGAVVPGARVVITNKDTAQTKEVTTNDEGYYFVPSLNPGNYSVLVEASGMKKWQGDTVLQVGQRLVVDANLEIGSVSAEVTVAGDVGQLITTTDATISNTLNATRIEQLATNGRDLNTLLTLTTPGFEGNDPATTDVNGESDRNQRFNGLRAGSFEIVQDGAPVVDRDQGRVFGRPVSLESIKEVRIETSVSSAKMNRPGLAIITTKGGGNDLHGSIFETHRNNGFGLARRRQDRFSQPPQFIRNEFGGSIGGPVFLPRFGEGVPHLYNGRDRTFFFVAFEGLELRQQISSLGRVPTEAMRRGDFSNLLQLDTGPVTIYDPLTTRATGQCYQEADESGNLVWVASQYCRDPFPNNQIPMDRISPLAQRVWGMLPLPTNDNNPYLDNNWSGTYPNNTTHRKWTARMDHRFTDNDQVFFRYSYGNLYRTTLNPGFVLLPLPVGIDASDYSVTLGQNGALSWVHTFSPTFVSETLISHSYEYPGTVTGPEPGKNWASEWGLPNPFGITGWPGIDSHGFSRFGRSNTTRDSYNNITNIDENLTWVKGAHQMEFGGRVRLESLALLPDQGKAANVGFPNTPVGVNFANGWTALADPTDPQYDLAIARTGTTAADFFLGYASRYGVRLNQSRYHFTDREYAGYFQDNWAVNRRLTLNIGLRWEAHPAFAERNNYLSTFDVNDGSVVLGASLEDLYSDGATTPNIIEGYQKLGVKFKTQEGGFLKDNWFDIGPRVGFAWKALGEDRPFVVRGGYAVFTYPAALRNFYPRIGSNPPYSANFEKRWDDSSLDPNAPRRTNYYYRAIPDIIAGLNSSDLISRDDAAAGLGKPAVSIVGPDYPSTKVHQFNASIEKEFWNKFVGRVSVLYNKAKYLDQYSQINEGPASDYVWYTRHKDDGLADAVTGDKRRAYNFATNTDSYRMIEFLGKTGVSNSTSFQFNLERRFADGYAVQAFYSLTNAFKSGGNGWVDNFLYPESRYAPGLVPEDDVERARFLNYARDTGVPKHRIRWNWLADVPLGKGKWLLGDAPGRLNAIIGGWQFSGNGTFFSSLRGVDTTNWGTDNAPIEVYGKKHLIKRCARNSPTSPETCTEYYMWYNGYIAEKYRNQWGFSDNNPNRTNQAQIAYFGLPENYQPASVPLIAAPANYTDPAVANAPGLCGRRAWQDWDTNNVAIAYKRPNGTEGCKWTAYNPGVHPWHKTFIPGPFNWNVDVSLYKTFSFNERVRLRVNLDVFNVFNNPGDPLNEYSPEFGGRTRSTVNWNNPRQFQGSLRLTF